MTKGISQGFPEIPKSLLDELEKRFPNRIPTEPKITEADFRMLQGQQQVIALLRHQFNLQNQTILENEANVHDNA